MSWAGVRSAMSAGIVGSSVTDRVTYYSRTGPRTISATLERSNVDDLEVNTPSAMMAAQACDIDAEPHGQRVDLDGISYTIREAQDDGDEWLVIHLTRADR